MSSNQTKKDETAFSSCYTQYLDEWFEEKWNSSFKAKYGDSFWYDAKKFCYTFDLLGNNQVSAVFDFYPKADKVFVKHKNRWMKDGLNWILLNLLS